MSLKPGCQQIATETSLLYVRTHDLLQALLNLQVPPEGLLESLERSLAPKEHTRTSLPEEHIRTSLSEKERYPLIESLTNVTDHLPQGELEKLPGHERFSRFKPSIDAADKLLSEVQELMFTKVVNCECKGG